MEPLLKVNAVTMHVPDLDTALAFYRDGLGHPLLWRNDAIGQAGLGMPESDTEIVPTVEHSYEPNWLVESADSAAEAFVAAGGSVLVEPVEIPVGRLGVVRDPFGNVLTLLDLSQGHVLIVSGQ